MREAILPPSKSKLRLLDAAERLFAEKGFEMVAVRDITQLAKANVAAVNYHFGSRDGLLALVVSRYITPVNQDRLVRLDALERKWSGKVVPLEELIDAFVRPVTGVGRQSELSERLFCKLVGRIFALPGEELPLAVEEQTKELMNRYTLAIGKTLPSVPQEELVWRLHFLVGSIIHMLVNQEMLHQLSNGASGSPSMEVTLGRCIRFAVAGLRELGEMEIEPLVTEPIVAEPLEAEPLEAEPMETEPMEAEPMEAEPMVAEPLAAEPIVTEPMVAEPMETEPMETEPMVTEPMETEPMAAEPEKSPQATFDFDF